MTRLDTNKVNLRSATHRPLQHLGGKCALVTGGSQGMGLEIVRGLVTLGADVVMISRDPERGRAAVADVKRSTGADSIQFIQADLSSRDAVRRAVAELNASRSRLDILVNNAGNHFQRRRASIDGIEQSW